MIGPRSVPIEATVLPRCRLVRAKSIILCPSPQDSDGRTASFVNVPVIVHTMPQRTYCNIDNAIDSRVCACICVVIRCQQCQQCQQFSDHAGFRVLPPIRQGDNR